MGAPTPSFYVGASPEVRTALRAATTPREVKDEFRVLVRALRSSGCRAATYRLSGPGEWPRFCVYRFAARSFRLVMEFPAHDEVALLVLMRHDNRNDPAAWLRERYGLPRITDLSHWRPVRAPACCDDALAPPLAANVADSAFNLSGP